MVEALIFAMVGLAAGIVVNILADRLPADLGLAGGPVCPACHRNLPVSRVSGLWRELSRARACPGCHTRLPIRHAIVEVSMAVLFAFLWQRYGLSSELALDALFLIILALIFIVDLEHRLVLNTVVLPAAGLAVLTSPIGPGLVSALIGGAVGFALLYACFFVYPKGLGAGDVKLAGFIGLMLGWPVVLPGLFLGFALAAAVSIGLLLTGRASMKTYIPYAPFLVVGAFLALLFLMNNFAI
ncbi:MAG: A24 family peptidase [Dehalococcoidia bacterium]|nr:A24 family peptidase [Dehalococcoidia bacterium]